MNGYVNSYERVSSTSNWEGIKQTRQVLLLLQVHPITIVTSRFDALWLDECNFRYCFSWFLKNEGQSDVSVRVVQFLSPSVCTSRLTLSPNAAGDAGLWD